MKKALQDKEQSREPWNTDVQPLVEQLKSLTRSRAEMAKVAGVTTQTIGAWLRNSRSCSWKNFEKLKQAVASLRRQFPRRGC